ncbi:MAG TPA: hypothetical protein VFG81_13260 [Anaerolineales bacterium]|jgi:hypothetical protein|nr:hypothetical protein [Anaerolineales bacterium]
MAQIKFRGQIYNNEFEMPYEIRQAYRREKQERNTARETPLTDIVDMSPEVKRIYERALGDVEDKLPASRQSKDLPKTEDIYRQSAPEGMKDLPSDESIYRPSQPLIDPGKSVIEPESAIGMSRFVSSIVWAFILVAVAFIILQFLR